MSFALVMTLSDATPLLVLNYNPVVELEQRLCPANLAGWKEVLLRFSSQLNCRQKTGALRYVTSFRELSYYLHGGRSRVKINLSWLDAVRLDMNAASLSGCGDSMTLISVLPALSGCLSVAGCLSRQGMAHRCIA